MSFDKVEIIKGTLERQIEIYEKQAEVARKEVDEHEGAFQALDQMAKQMPGFAASIEKRIESDLELGSAANKVSIYCKNIIARFTTMCTANSEAQKNNKFICEGRRDASDMVIANMKKEITITVAHEERRQELERDREQKRITQAAEEDAEAKRVRSGFKAAEEAQAAAEEVSGEVDNILTKQQDVPSNGKPGVPDKVSKPPAVKKPKKPRKKRRTKAQITADKKAAEEKNAPQQKTD